LFVANVLCRKYDGGQSFYFKFVVHPVSNSRLFVVAGINIFLAYFLLLKLMAGSTPSSSSIPLLGQLLLKNKGVSKGICGLKIALVAEYVANLLHVSAWL